MHLCYPMWKSHCFSAKEQAGLRVHVQFYIVFFSGEKKTCWRTVREAILALLAQVLHRAQSDDAGLSTTTPHTETLETFDKTGEEKYSHNY